MALYWDRDMVMSRGHDPISVAEVWLGPRGIEQSY